MSEQIRNTILTELAKHTGKRVSWKFIKQTSSFLPSIERFHNLITGIYKPIWSDYALSINIGISSPYEKKDEVIFLEDGRWLMTYSPRSGGLNDNSDNRALVKCMDEHMPIGVFKQLTDKTDRKYGSTYRVLGLGIITAYDPNVDVFVIESADQVAIDYVINVVADENIRYEIYLYSQVMNSFERFVKEESITYTVTMPKRDKAFREVVTREYDFACAVCQMKFLLGNLFEATAAHIIPKHESGTDDPRNGLSLCRTHHWAFDQGLFTIADDFKLRLSPVVQYAQTQNFSLLAMEDKKIALPQNETLWPHPEALNWHKNHIWRSD